MLQVSVAKSIQLGDTVDIESKNETILYSQEFNVLRELYVFTRNQTTVEIVFPAHLKKK